MNIVLLADNKKTGLLINLCLAYRQILGKYNLISTQNSAKQINNATGLKIHTMPTEIRGAMDQFAAMTIYNEIDAVILLRDPDVVDYSPNPLLRACDLKNIPYATNIASAELLMLILGHGG
ncbi:MAG: methylglyoxal synthase [Saccharofermentanales bacterium]|nr:methylglyoxal synthase [Bacillota bacterium]NLB09029.1 methylglyoxal synthase [Clostridiales bacterium]